MAKTDWVQKFHRQQYEMSEAREEARQEQEALEARMRQARAAKSEKAKSLKGRIISQLKKASPKKAYKEEMKFRKRVGEAYEKGYTSGKISQARKAGKLASGWTPTKKGRGRPKNIENIPSQELERRIEALESRKELETKFATLSGRELEQPVRRGGITADISTWFGNGEKKKKRLTLW